MTEEMKYLVMLCTCGATGKVCPPPTAEIDWRRLVALANEQSMTYVAAIAIKNSQNGCPQEILSSLYSNLLGASLKNKMRVASIIALLGRMEQHGLHPTVLKGIDAARFYANPECRPSADTDILVPTNEETSTLDFLRAEGFEITPRESQMHHTVCHHPVYGMFEVHISLWEESYDREIFETAGLSGSLAESAQRIVTSDGEYDALADFDRLMFVTLHMLKHFVICGTSLRMMVDSALCWQKCTPQQRELFWQNLRQLRFEKTVASLFDALKKYGCFFENEKFLLADDDSVETVVSDLEKGGWQGKNDDAARREGWYYLCRERRISQKGRLGYYLFIVQLILPDKLRALFPPAVHLFADYPRLQKHRWLYPLCWFHRLFGKGLSALKSGRTKSRINIENESNLKPAGRERFEMFRQLGL